MRTSPISAIFEDHVEEHLTTRGLAPVRHIPTHAPARQTAGQARPDWRVSTSAGPVFVEATVCKVIDELRTPPAALRIAEDLTSTREQLRGLDPTSSDARALREDEAELLADLEVTAPMLELVHGIDPVEALTRTIEDKTDQIPVSDPMLLVVAVVHVIVDGTGSRRVGTPVMDRGQLRDAEAGATLPCADIGATVLREAVAEGLRRAGVLPGNLPPLAVLLSGSFPGAPLTVTSAVANVAGVRHLGAVFPGTPHVLL